MSVKNIATVTAIAITSVSHDEATLKVVSDIEKEVIVDVRKVLHGPVGQIRLTKNQARMLAVALLEAAKVMT